MITWRLYQVSCCASLVEPREEAGSEFRGNSVEVKSPPIRAPGRFRMNRLSECVGAVCTGAPDHRTTRIEQVLCCTSFVDTLPSRKRATAPRPFAPETMRSTFRWSATFMISSAGWPSWQISSTS